MNCPNCTEALEADVWDMDERWEELVVRIPEVSFYDGNSLTTKFLLKDLINSYSTHICPKCKCIVLRCEE